MNEVLRVIKGISPDKTYIDYVRGNYGVRVWKDRWQPIARADRESDWQRGELHRITGGTPTGELRGAVFFQVNTIDVACPTVRLMYTMPGTGELDYPVPTPAGSTLPR